MNTYEKKDVCLPHFLMFVPHPYVSDTAHFVSDSGFLRNRMCSQRQCTVIWERIPGIEVINCW